ncbi:uncharacterized protein LOC129578450 isoform X1 [Sitodiplosis mosellana]|uniref:uncharacterized protein LOC129578450 isoform X1 n=1 Tax=Sitodiplosis mosellana TaxID=263140 RepID=UPI002444FE1C|nr:uncharacterized protein LOC129578450 isoform X1 [Sitodiplosis mosellana]XP_055323051.1 uncharacterized protein LOC129578450 isoform X1 [Sitodiplosis mosellana]XP_055323054.1 uncharacterized protein LOC129578450 isoform X1 [Sitodiplosis mosellana]XP_055323055.1 uncharacterized protein LOC129578450 isoform X1 [Sitodiplosis mosellana]
MCFQGVLRQNYTNDRMFMVPGFRQMVINILGEWFPWQTNRFFGNTFKYLYEQYATNVKNNLKTHCEQRLRKFFKMRCYELNHMCLCGDLELDELFDGDDIKNAISYTYNRRDSTRGNANAIRKLEILLAELYWIGAPYRPDDPHPFNIREFVELNWFQALRMFINIQRYIHNFHLSFANLRQSWNLFRKYPLYVQQPEFPEPPEITTFTVIPKCTFQRRHVKIDTDALYNILCGVKAMKRTKGTRVLRNGEFQQRYISQTEFKRISSWRSYFNMDEIIKLVKNKKEFGDSIISDGVSASVLFKLPKQSKTVADEEEAETKRKYFANEFAYALGIDPGMRTFIASVRLDLKTGEETNEKISFKQYHQKSKQDARNIKAERMTNKRTSNVSPQRLARHHRHGTSLGAITSNIACECSKIVSRHTVRKTMHAYVWTNTLNGVVQLISSPVSWYISRQLSSTSEQPKFHQIARSESKSTCGVQAFAS